MEQYFHVQYYVSQCEYILWLEPASEPKQLWAEPEMMQRVTYRSILLWAYMQLIKCPVKFNFNTLLSAL